MPHYRTAQGIVIHLCEVVLEGFAPILKAKTVVLMNGHSGTLFSAPLWIPYWRSEIMSHFYVVRRLIGSFLSIP